MQARKIIGRIDKADFPEFQLENVDVKIDTGAYGSSLHCDLAEEYESDGQQRLRFVLDLGETHQEFHTSHFTTKSVKSSSGLAEERYTVETDIVLFGKVFTQQFSLSNRENMKFPVLLGRILLSRNFIVDTARTNLSYKQKLKKETPK